MKLVSRSVLPAAVLAAAAASFISSAHASPLGSTLGLVAESAAPGGTLDFRLFTPYPGRRFTIQALSPSREAFEVAAGLTDAAGRGEAAAVVRAEPSLAGMNATFHAVLAPQDGLPEVRSAPLHLEIRSRAGATPAGFTLHPGGLEGLQAPRAATIADLDGDGDLDLIAAVAGEGGAALEVLAGDGAGSFAAGGFRFLPAPPPSPRSLGVADFDLDGDLDLFSGGSETSENALFLSDGTGAFELAEGFPAKAEEGARAGGAVFADLDADGYPDLFIANGIAGGHGVEAVAQPNQLLLNRGGRFEPVELPEGLDPAVSRAVAAGDVDLDGDLDLVVANSGANHLLLNDGGARFEDGSERLPAASESTAGVALADVDFDGDLDVILAGSVFSPRAQVLLLNSGGRQGGAAGFFEVGPFPALAAGQTPIRLGLEVNDFDGDGDLDILFATHELGNAERPDLYINQGGAQGGEAGTYLRDEAFPAIAGVYQTLPSGDIDGDGDVDIVAVPSRGGGGILLNQLFSAPDPPLGFQRGDVNGDSRHDLSDAIAVLAHLFLGAAAPGCLAAADTDRSGGLDLTDAIALLGYLFLGGPPPAAPFPGFGDDPDAGDLGCARVEVFQPAGR